MSETCEHCDSDAVGKFETDDPGAFENRKEWLCEDHLAEAEERGAVVREF